MFDKLTEVIKCFKSYHVKEEAYLEPNRAFFVKIVNKLYFRKKNSIIDTHLSSKEISENNEIFKTKLGWTIVIVATRSVSFF